MTTLLQGETLLEPDAFDQPIIIRLQRSLYQWWLVMLATACLIGIGVWQCVLPHFLLPFIVIVAYIQGQPVTLPLLKYHRHQWWCFHLSEWSPITLEPCYIGSWLISMNIDDKNITVWPDSCSERAQWFLRRALLARQRAVQHALPPPSVWQRLWQKMLS